ncbi:PBP1 and LysM peptidoglycan-binding domain-containing protein [Ascidiimonas aurantiaca]|uniref:PBP1 and LysM peptidoglycan-binding domain-containing protein n=1 Tax=Ascidiimonas aurantiaca TaxID=1685432 RepID=UPI0030EF5229
MRKFLIAFFVVVFSVSVSFAQQFKTHAVKEGETLEEIARVYKVSIADITRLNPEIKNGLKPNTILVIPVTSVQVKQTPDITVRVPEVTFIKHRVRRKETLYSLSKEYDITVDDIKKYNKELYSRELKKGERIRIPQFPQRRELAAQDTIPEGLMLYKVKPKEGKWRVAYTHGITLNELEELNPDMSEYLTEGQMLYVPEKVEEKKVRVIDSLYNYYTVKPKEGFYRLKVKLGLTREELEELNPDIKNTGLKAGMVLKTGKTVPDAFLVNNGLLVEKFSLIDSLNVYNTPHIAIMLPFKAQQALTSSDEALKERITSDRLMSYSLDFYTGVLMAIDSIKKLGLSVNVRVFDTEANDKVTQRLFYNESFVGVDAVIGPLLPKTFNVASRELSKINIPIFSLVGSKNFEPQPNVFLSYPDDEAMYVKMASFLDRHAKEVNMVIIADKKNEGVRQRLTTRFPQAKILEPHEDKFIRIDDITPLLATDEENWVLVETEEVSLIANITSVLNSTLSEKFAIKMFTTRKSDAFEDINISNSYLSNLNFHFPSVNGIITSNNRFSRLYQDRYGTLPGKYAVRGFDLTFDILLKLGYQKNLLALAQRIGETEYVENKFNYVKKWSGVYANNSVYILYYEDLEVKQEPDVQLSDLSSAK